MSMYRIYALVCLSLFFTSAYGQGNSARLMELGEEAFRANHFQSAIDYYRQAEAGDPDNATIQYMLGECYRSAFQYAEAEVCYKKVAMHASNLYPLLYFQLGITEKMNSRYSEAVDTFDQFLKYAASTDFADKVSYVDQAAIEKEGCRIAISHTAIAFREFNMENLPEPVNSKNNDYAAYPYGSDDIIVITSGRDEAIGKKEDFGFDEDHTDCFRFVKDVGVWKPLVVDDDFDKTNGVFHEGAGTFNNDDTKYYFTRCASSGCAIYVTELKDGKWLSPIKLNENVNAKGTDSKHPFVSVTGDTLYFISNRPGGYGMNDIYISVIGNGQWGPAINLGSKINTKLNEASPFYFSKEHMFCFSSQGHAGYGGLDIFTVRNLFTQPDIRNIGKPFNSPADDFYFVFGAKRGFLSSNRPGGKGRFDIYTFIINAEESVIALLEKGDSVLSESMGVVTQTVDPASDVGVENSRNLTNAINRFKLGGANNVSVSGKLNDVLTGKTLPDVEVVLVDEHGKTVKSTSTNADGFFQYMDVPLTENYKLVIKRGESLISDLYELGITNLKVEGFKEKPMVRKFESIYFDFDEVFLRPESQRVLDDLVLFCQRSRDVQIEIDAFTDMVGPNDYNDELSSKRGAGALSYLTGKGVDRSLLVMVAKGERNPVASNETRGGRQLNRRVEFLIKGGEDIVPVADIYIIEPGMTLYSLAKKYRTTVDELKKLNGLTSNYIAAYRALRVPTTGKITLPERRSGRAKQPATGDVDGTYVIKRGDTVFSIAVSHNMTVEGFEQLNSIKNHLILPGQVVRIKQRRIQ